MDYPAPEKKPGEDEILDLTLDEAPAPVAAPGDVLEITLDDLSGDESAYPEVTEVQQRAAVNSALLQCQCSATRQGFQVTFEEQEPGVYYAGAVTPTGKGPMGKATAATGKVDSGLSEIKGTFRMGPEYACACCGSKVLSVCEKCGTVLCGGGTTKGGGCACPGCGTELTLTGEAATAARGSASGKKKGLW